MPGLARDAYKRNWDVHAGLGVAAGLCLYLIFVSGTFTLFHEALELWEEPLRQAPVRVPHALQPVLDVTLAALPEPPSELWLIPQAARGLPEVSYRMPEASWSRAFVDVPGARLIPQCERLAHFIYELHFFWHEATGQLPFWGAGLLGIALLLAAATGLMVALRQSWKHFGAVRTRLAPRHWLADLHKLLAIIGLPFQAMYGYTGALLVLGPVLLRAFVGPVFHGDEARAASLALGLPAHVLEPAGHAAIAPLALDELARRARAAVPGFEPRAFRLVQPLAATTTLEIWGTRREARHEQVAVALRAYDGAISYLPPPLAGMSRARLWLHELHYARSLGLPLRLAYALFALATCAAIVSGLQLWLARRARRSGRAHRWLSGVTTGVGAGAWAALGCLFAASRALPDGWSRRGHLEELVYFAALGGCVLWALVARSQRQTACLQLYAAAGAFAVTPLLAAGRSRHGLLGSGPVVDEVVGVELGLLLTAAALALCAARLQPRTRAEPLDAAAALALPRGGHG